MVICKCVALAVGTNSSVISIGKVIPLSILLVLSEMKASYIHTVGCDGHLFSVWWDYDILKVSVAFPGLPA